MLSRICSELSSPNRVGRVTRHASSTFTKRLLNPFSKGQKERPQAGPKPSVLSLIDSAVGIPEQEKVMRQMVEEYNFDVYKKKGQKIDSDRAQFTFAAASEYNDMMTYHSKREETQKLIEWYDKAAEDGRADHHSRGIVITHLIQSKNTPLLKKWLSSNGPNLGRSDYSSVMGYFAREREMGAMLYYFHQMMAHLQVHAYITPYNIVLKYYSRNKFNGRLKAWLEKMNSVEGLFMNSVTYAIMIHHYGVYSDDTQEMIHWVERAESNQVQLNAQAYGSIIFHFYRKKDDQQVTDWMNRMIKAGVPPEESTFTTLLSESIAREDHQGLDKWMDTMSSVFITPTLLSYSTIIKAYSEKEDSERMIRWYKKMVENRIQPDQTMHGIFLNFFAKAGDTSNALTWAKNMTSSGIVLDTKNRNIVLKSFVMAGDEKGMTEEFEKMKREGRVNTATYNTMLGLYSGQGNTYSLLKCFNGMNMGRPDMGTYTIIINHFAKAKQKENVLHWLGEMKKALKYRVDNQTYNRIMGYYLGSTDPNELIFWFDLMIQSGINPSLQSYQIIVSWYLGKEDIEEAMRWLSQMRAQGHKGNVKFYGNLFHHAAIINNEQITDRLLAEMEQDDIEMDGDILSLLAVRRAATGDTSSLRDVIEMMKNSNVKLEPSLFANILTPLMNQPSLKTEIASIAEDLSSVGGTLDTSCFNLMIEYFSSQEDSELCQKWFQLMIEQGSTRDEHTYHSLIRLYSMSNNSRAMEKCFKDMLEDSANIQNREEIYHTIVSHYIANYKLKKVEQWMKKMTKERCKPQEWMYNSIISQCNINGDTEALLFWFQEMTEEGTPTKTTFEPIFHHFTVVRPDTEKRAIEPTSCVMGLVLDHFSGLKDIRKVMSLLEDVHRFSLSVHPSTFKNIIQMKSLRGGEVLTDKLLRSLKMEGPSKRPRRHSHTAAMERGKNVPPGMTLGPIKDISSMHHHWELPPQLPPLSPSLGGMQKQGELASPSKGPAPPYLGRPLDFAPRRNDEGMVPHMRPRSMTTIESRVSRIVEDSTIDDVAASLHSLSEDARIIKSGEIDYRHQLFVLSGFPPSVHIPPTMRRNMWDDKVILNDGQGSPHISTKCARCNQLLTVDKQQVYFSGKTYHSSCFQCAVCDEPLESSCIPVDDKLYCEKDYAKLMENRKDRELPNNIRLTLTAQPARFQISNYNIHPPPALTTDVRTVPLDDNYTVYVHLCEAQQKKIIAGGLQSGDVRVLRMGQTTIYFNGLKLNKMGPIKTEINFRNSRQLSTDFCIRFKLGDRVFYSSVFKLVSSCSQLPQDIRDNVRPSKKAAPTVKSAKTLDSPPASPSPPKSPNRNPSDLGMNNSPSMTNDNQLINSINTITEQPKTMEDVSRIKQEGETPQPTLESNESEQTEIPEDANEKTNRNPLKRTDKTELDAFRIREEFESCVSTGDEEGAARYGRLLAQMYNTLKKPKEGSN
ncbi:putative pentatricopeptide repeat-containing protein [Planoprotostelium fungivorum]|uniref:Putative pentatricopeptide repeat-containing protein n=1 Tax=Planoprotostelium fungivorum TaxID=1890364 RepID=A0A2P6N9V6_9EUKA|nr:putative pentatricopeptide repeat-containing protein [Planoprotostelium fungivorum]